MRIRPEYFDAEHTQMLVRPNDIDRLQHANHAAILELLEAARWEWLARKRLLNGTSVVPVVIRAEVDYLRELPQGTVSVTTALLRPVAGSGADVDWETTYRAVMHQQMAFDSRRDVAVDAKIHVGFVDVTERTLRSLAEYLETASASAE